MILLLLHKFKLTGLNYSDFVFQSRYTNAEDAQTLSDETTDKEEEEVMTENNQKIELINRMLSDLTEDRLAPKVWFCFSAFVAEQRKAIDWSTHWHKQLLCPISINTVKCSSN